MLDALLGLLSIFIGGLLAGGTPRFYGIVLLAAAAITAGVWRVLSLGPFTFAATCWLGGAVVVGVALLVWHWVTEPIREQQRKSRSQLGVRS